eukprot:1151629-Prymnesium_polylepis.1
MEPRAASQRGPCCTYFVHATSFASRASLGHTWTHSRPASTRDHRSRSTRAIETLGRELPSLRCGHRAITTPPFFSHESRNSSWTRVWPRMNVHVRQRT